MVLTVKRITDKADPCIETMSSWLWNWWAEADGFTRGELHAYMLAHVYPRDRIPLTCGLFDGGVPVGMYQLSMADCTVRPDVYPWLINVYVEPSHRRQGGLRLMMASALADMRRLGLDELYLYTDHTVLYEKFGFTFVEQFNTFSSVGVQRLYVLKKT